MVFNVESENGYRVSILDKTNSTEAVYWTTDFLGLEQCEDNYFQTSNYLKLCKDFVQEVYNQENDIPKADQIDMLNRSIDYFKKRILSMKTCSKKKLFPIRRSSMLLRISKTITKKRTNLR